MESDLRGSKKSSGAEGQRYFEEKYPFATFCSVLQEKKNHKTLQENILGGWTRMIQRLEKKNRGVVPTNGPYLTPAIQNSSYKDDHSLALNLYPVFS